MTSVKIKDQLFYWSAITIISGMLIYSHKEYKEQEKIVERLHSVSNRQVEIMAASYNSLLNQLSVKHAEEVVYLQEQHKQELEKLKDKAQQ